MDLLTIQHEDFTMYVDGTKFDDIWNKAKSNVGEKDLLSTYTWSEGVVSVERNGEPIAKGEKARAVFFDNAEYPVWVDFKKHVTKISIFGAMGTEVWVDDIEVYGYGIFDPYAPVTKNALKKSDSKKKD